MSTLRNIIGDDALAVWKAYLLNRRPDGTTTFRQEDAAKATGLRHNQVRGVINDKLKPANLYETRRKIGAIVRSAARDEAYRRRGTFLPTVRGALVSNVVAVVPDEVLDALTSMPRGRELLTLATSLGSGRDPGALVIPANPSLDRTEDPSGSEAGVESNALASKVGAECATPSGAFALQGGERCAPTLAEKNGLDLESEAGVRWIARRCVSALRVDGGTTFKLLAPRKGIDPDVEAALATAAGARPRPRIVQLEALDGEVITFWAKKVSRGMYVLDVDGHVRVEVKPRADHYAVKLIARAPALWTLGVGAWMDKWLRIATQWFLSRPWTGIDRAADLGWSVCALEVCSDIMNYGVTLERQLAFRSRARGDIVREGQHGARENRNLYAGGIRSGSGVSLSWHRKDRQLKNVRGQSVEESPYADALFHPQPVAYDGVSPLWRIELRASSVRVLRLQVKKRRVAVDLTRPDALLDRKALGIFWLYGTRLHRVARGNGATPKWLGVQALSGLSLNTPRIYAANARNKLSVKQTRRLKAMTKVRCLAKEYVASGDPTLLHEGSTYAWAWELTDYWQDRLAAELSATL